MASFSIPLSGLNAAQDELQTVSNNLANINTDGYKDESTLFSDIFAQTGAVDGAGDPMPSGLGVTSCATVSDFADGTPNPTGISSNMALSGNGFFVVQGSNGLNSYTRAGDFTTNQAGFLTTPEGDLVMGYPATNGVVQTSAPLQALQVGTNLTTPAVATSNIQVSANLDADTAASGTGPTSTVEIYDSLGQQHDVTISYTKSATDANEWTWTATVPAADLAAGGTGDTQVGTGTLYFNSDGTLDSTTTLNGVGGATPASSTPIGAITLPTFADGATGPQTIDGVFGTAGNPTITQTASESTTSGTNQNGYASGTLQSFAVQPDGTIEGTFSTGETLALGQVAVASFANNQGLNNVGGNNYQPTAASGGAVIGIAGNGGRGTITGGSVEQSNVDIATEFSRLIVAQQAYSANAKSVTTFNQISQATLQMLQ